MVESLDTVIYSCIFILPGFIIQEIIETLSPRGKISDTRYILRCLLYSITNCALLSWLYIAIGKLHSTHPYRYWLIMVGITIIGALLISIGIGLIEQHGCIPKFLWIFRIRSRHPQPTAWDYFFSLGDPVWVIVTLIDGSRIYGKYSDKSFTSSDSTERDIYIEETYILDDSGSWIPAKNSAGILIMKNQIQTIEFIH